MKTVGRIDRTGTISFGDASISVWEDGLGAARDAGGHKGERDWERRFKRDVFMRIIQTLNRTGWSVGRWDKSDQYKCIQLSHRTCRKGDLHAELSVSGRCIDFQMWQDATPSENPNGGRYDFSKQARMPYILRLEMERTRRKIRDYLCNVFTGYTFTQPKIASPNPDPLAYFNDSWDGEYEKRRGVHRFKRGPDGWPSEQEVTPSDRHDKDGIVMNHGDVRWMRDKTGRVIRGRVYGGINGMWIFVYGPGKRDYTHESARRFFTYQPGETIAKLADANVRRKRLERLMQTAVAAMDFDRAKTIKGLLFPTGPLYAIWHKEKTVYFDVWYSGYRNSLSDAGRYTRTELKPYFGDVLESDRFKAIPIAA